MVLRIVSSRLLSLIPRALRVLRVLSAADHVTVEAGPSRCAAECRRVAFVHLAGPGMIEGSSLFVPDHPNAP
jgi:hypothetical protein